MSPRTPEEGAAKDQIRSTRLGPTDDATLQRRRGERGESVTNYLRGLVREDGAKHPERPKRG